MSTLPSQARLSLDWKEEVNQRIAAHKNRKPAPVADQDSLIPEHHASSTRVAAAAARVAARFANEPRYSELIEDEARAAVQAAEVVSRAALEAQAAAESVLAEVQAAKASDAAWQFNEEDVPEAVPAIKRAYEHTIDELESQPAGRGPSRQADWNQPSAAFHARREPEASEVITPVRYDPEVIEMVEAAQPIHANLIEFPREIVAARKARPRRAEGPFAEQQDSASQLSIFEVDPEAISTEPAAAETINPAANPSWMAPEWYGMELDKQPADQPGTHAEPEFNERQVPLTIFDHRVAQAPLTMRLMAVLIDGSLVVAAFLFFAYELVKHLHTLPTMRTAEVLAAIGLLLTSAGYMALCYYMGPATPGMRYARIALSTFEGRVPSRDERLQRCKALLLSVLPVGVGVLWSIFDEDHLSWHDRLSRTYLRTY